MLEYKGVTWVLYQQVLIPDVPPHVPVALSREEARELLKRSGAYFIRWISDFDRGKEMAFWYIIKDTPDTLESLGRKVRYEVRRGLKHCTVRRTGADDIAENGWPVHVKAFEKYRSSAGPGSREMFVASIRKMQEPFWEFWSVLDPEGIMIAFAATRITEGCCKYDTVRFDPDYFHLNPSEALFYTLNDYYLHQKGVRYIDDGARSLAHDTSVQQYLIRKFGFRKAYCRMHVVYRPSVQLAVRLLYPFRRIIASFRNKFAARVTVLLKHEEVRRSLELR
ncbi:hypothetical protein WCX72_12320 [Sulfurimonas sp. HSL1-6]|uniref:hypothetical protein n=1 Tax=Thiomicrolovo immobilis TaxID=3131935 RepID=UPI0031FA325A